MWSLCWLHGLYFAMRLKTLGELRLEGTNFKRGRPLLLLAYLLLEGPQERRFLAELFWPQSTTALKNLTTVLTRLKKVDSGLVESEGHKLSSKLACDANELFLAFEQENYTLVIEGYSGRFLEGLSKHELSTELEEWIYNWRERLATKVRLARLNKAESLAKEKQFKEAAKQAEKAYLQAGADEPNDQDLKRIYSLLIAGQSRLAYEVQNEAKHYGLSFSLSTEDARQQLVETQAIKPSLEELIKHNLPRQATGFVGRQVELKLLDEKLNEAKCRLVSLMGPGGMGKTRLALALAEQQLKAARYKDGIYFISFVAVTSAEQMIVSLGEVLGLSFAGPLDPKTQLLSFVKDKSMLLILDNLEHLLSGATLVTDLLQAAGLKLLVTSRESLHLQAEHVFTIKGLANSKENQSEPSDAVQLFVQHAQMKQAEFKLGEANQDQVIAICEQLDGMPLAIELAASWLRVLNLQAIFDELKQSLDFLQANNRDLADRHKSMRAVFNYSWQLLTEEEQAALQKLAVFTGGFSREAANAIANVSLLELASLIDKSLLNTTDDGRYKRHPLVIEYSYEKLTEKPVEKTALEESHGTYYLKLVKKQAPLLRTLKRKDTLEYLEPDFPNIKAAWAWAINTKNCDLITETAFPLNEVFLHRLPEGEQLFSSALQQLNPENANHRKALGRIYISQAKLQRWLANPKYKQELAMKGLTFLEAIDDKEGMIQGILQAGDFRQANNTENQQNSPFQKGLQLARQLGTTADICDYLWDQLLYERETGEFEVVIKHFDSALEEVAALGDQLILAVMQLVYGAYLSYHMQYEKGIVLLKKSLSLSQMLDAKAAISSCLSEIGFSLFRLKKYSEAKNYFLQAIQDAQETGITEFQAKGYTYLGRILITDQDYEKAYQVLIKSLNLTLKHKQASQTLECLLGFVDYYEALQQNTKAISLLKFIAKHPHTEIRERLQAEEALSTLKEQFSKETQEVKLLELEIIVQEILDHQIR